MVVPGVEGKHRDVVPWAGRGDRVQRLATDGGWLGWMAASRQSKPGVHDEGRRNAEDQGGEAARQRGHTCGKLHAHEVTGQRRKDVREHRDTAPAMATTSAKLAPHKTSKASRRFSA